MKGLPCVCITEQFLADASEIVAGLDLAVGLEEIDHW
jgi:hypothetical protein